MLYEILINDYQKWDNIIKGFNNVEVFYLNSYAKAFQLHGEGIPLLLYYEDGAGKAINVVMKRDLADCVHFRGKIKEGEYFDLSSPYGYGGFIREGNIDWDLLNQEYLAYCLRSGIVSEFVRFNLFSDYYKNYFGTVESRSRNVVRTLELSHDEMWMDFEQKVRKNVKKASKHNLDIIVTASDSTNNLHNFVNIYYKTMSRTQAHDSYYFKDNFFDSINNMHNNVAYFYVICNGNIIATELVLYGTENAYSFLGGTLNEYFEMRPNDFLKHEIIKWAKDKGLKRFVLGGGYGKDDSIFRYKQSFAPNGVVDFHIGKKIFDIDKYNKLKAMRKEGIIFDELTLFFPAYRF